MNITLLKFEFAYQTSWTVAFIPVFDSQLFPRPGKLSVHSLVPLPQRCSCTDKPHSLGQFRVADLSKRLVRY